MTRLCQTDGTTENHTEIVKAVRQFVDEKIIPVAQLKSTDRARRARRNLGPTDSDNWADSHGGRRYRAAFHFP